MPDLKCPDCHASIGEPHAIECDVARCLVTGRQRISCFDTHFCGEQKWTGRWPGEEECERYGWMIDLGNQGKLPDLNRLFMECEWDPEQEAWVKR